MSSRILSGSIFILVMMIPLILIPESKAENGIGYLWITSKPRYALIYLDSDYINQLTPTSKLLNLKAGDYMLELAKQEYKLFEGKITIQAGKILEVNVTLAKLDSKEPSKITGKRYVEAYIAVRTNPQGADVYIDDKHIGKTPSVPYAIVDERPEDRTIKIEKAGFMPHTEIVSWKDIREKINIQVSASLRPLDRTGKPLPPPKPQRDKRFIINNQVIALFVLLLVVIGITVARIIVRTRRRNENG